MPTPDSSVPGPDRDTVRLLQAAAAGDAAARTELMERLYAELRRIAERIYSSAGSRGHTLQPTAVVHEAFLKLASGRFEFEGRRHFLCAAARVMRQVMLNHARDKQADKRGGGRIAVRLEDHEVVAPPAEFDVLELEEAMSALEVIDERQVRIVELRYFAGLSVEETAAALAVSVTTVKNEWRMARAELARRLQEPRGGSRARG
ncbi:MAG: ECF-type sigma factor [Planctomycetota bacterium]